jgi:hypothetical protein
MAHPVWLAVGDDGYPLAVPEPTTWLLLCAGIACVVLAKRRATLRHT